jgi:hypothetical protein
MISVDSGIASAGLTTPAKPVHASPSIAIAKISKRLTSDAPLL